MAEQPNLPANPTPTAPGPTTKDRLGPFAWDWLAFRRDIPPWQSVLIGVLCLAVVFGLWWFVTRGKSNEERILTSYKLPSPKETFARFRSLWDAPGEGTYDEEGNWVPPTEGRDLPLQTYVSIRRVALGFGLAALVGIPLGVLCGSFRRVEAFFLPLTIFGRNIPMAALIPLTFNLFGIAETQKVMFIFIASVAFVISDTARAIQDVSGTYIDTAYTLGASRWQVILKVLVPLAMPSVFNSLRLLFGLAFGYIMLAEVVKFGGEAGGLGDIIDTSQRIGPREHIYLVLLVIPVVALGIDLLLRGIQHELFPHRYEGYGLLHQGLRRLMHTWEDFLFLFRKPAAAPRLTSTPAGKPDGGPR